MRSKFLLNAAARRELTGDKGEEHAHSPRIGDCTMSAVRRSGALGEQVPNFLEKHFLAGRWRGRDFSGRRLFQTVDELDGAEKHERDDDKIEDVLDECAVLDKDVLAGGILAQPEGQVREVETADDLAEKRHKNIAHQGGYDFSEGS